MSLRRFTALALGALLLAGLPLGTRAAGEPFEIDVMLPLTGFGGFIGKAEQDSIRAIEASVNKHGGIDGRQIKFVVHDDQTNPQTGVQLANQLIAKKDQVLLGGAPVPVCRAMMPLVKNGPVLYCFSPGVHPDAGSFAYSSSISTNDLIAVNFRYWRDRGIKKVAVITSTDASGQDADRAIDAALAMREDLKQMNQETPDDPVRMRIAINSGIGMTGDIGSPRRREFTVLGDVVNACSRIESTVCKPDQIVCSRATLDRAKKSYNTRSLGMVTLRGRQAEMEVFEIL